DLFHCVLSYIRQMNQPTVRCTWNHVRFDGRYKVLFFVIMIAFQLRGPRMHWSDRIGHRLRPRDLHILLAVVERGNMAKAAEWLAISRPVVSKAIADLEQTFGVRLLDRSPQGLEPTLYGRALLKSTVAIFDQLRRSVQEIDSLADPTTGELRIGCTEAMAAGFLNAVIERFLSQYPGTCVDLTCAETKTLQYREIRERNIELMIGRLQSPFDEDDL